MMEPKCDWPRTSTLGIPKEANNEENNKIILKINELRKKKERTIGPKKQCVTRSMQTNNR